jgi:hypothetical protein
MIFYLLLTNYFLTFPYPFAIPSLYHRLVGWKKRNEKQCLVISNLLFVVRYSLRLRSGQVLFPSTTLRASVVPFDYAQGKCCSFDCAQGKCCSFDTLASTWFGSAHQPTLSHRRASVVRSVTIGQRWNPHLENLQN